MHGYHIITYNHFPFSLIFLIITLFSLNVCIAVMTLACINLVRLMPKLSSHLLKKKKKSCFSVCKFSMESYSFFRAFIIQHIS